VRDELEGSKPKKSQDKEFEAKLDMYGSMAHYLSGKLHIRPTEILDSWSVPELLVAYGTFANEDAQKNFSEWKSLEPKQRTKITRPKEYVVYFAGVI